MERGHIRLRGVSRRFKLVHDRNATIKETLIRRKRVAYSELWALKDVDLDIHPGEAVAFVGRNGAGKSTLLKVLAGILPPHGGTVEAEGQVAAMLELGSGFHPDFTGRENVYMNGALHGLRARDVSSRLAQIIEFSELADFIDMPVRTYSSGMQMRLAFAVAAHVNPDILLLDEVLTVGDAAFQEKCMARIQGFLDNGGTLAFVSHDRGAVEEVCTRALLIDGGRILADGTPADVLAAYEGLLVAGEGAIGAAIDPADHQTPEEAAHVGRDASPAAEITGLAVTPPGGPGVPCATGDRVQVAVDVDNHERVADLDLEIVVTNAARQEVIGVHSLDARLQLPRDRGLFRCVVDIPLPLQEGPVDIRPLLRDAATGALLDRWPTAGTVTMARGFDGEGIVAGPSRWDLLGPPVDDGVGSPDDDGVSRITAAAIIAPVPGNGQGPLGRMAAGDEVVLEVEITNTAPARTLDLEVVASNLAQQEVLVLHSVDAGIQLPRDVGRYRCRVAMPLPLQEGPININPSLRDVRLNRRVDQWPEPIGVLMTPTWPGEGAVAVETTWNLIRDPGDPLPTTEAPPAAATAIPARRSHGAARITDVVVQGAGAGTVVELAADDELHVDVEVTNEEQVVAMDLEVAIMNTGGLRLITVHSLDGGVHLPSDPGVNRVRVTLPLPLQTGDLRVHAALRAAATGRVVHEWGDPVRIRMRPTFDGDGVVAVRAGWSALPAAKQPGSSPH